MAKALRPEQLWLRSVLYGKRSKPIPLWDASGDRCSSALLDFVGEATRACAFLRRKIGRSTPRFVDDAIYGALGYRSRWDLRDGFGTCVDAAEAIRLACLHPQGGPSNLHYAVRDAVGNFGFVESTRWRITRYPGVDTFFNWATGGRRLDAQKRIP